MFAAKVAEVFSTKLLKDAGISISTTVVTFELLPLSKHASIKSVGEVRAATLRANQLLELQRIDAKSWKQHTISDHEKHAAPAYIDPDESPMQIRVEMATKRVNNLLEVQHNGKNFEYNRRTAIFSMGWCRRGQVSAPDRSTTLLKFNNANCTKHNLDPACVGSKFAKDFGEPELTEFS